MSGLRERKKQQTRVAIQREALRLIAERGYEATTCEQIAAAAEVSAATLFRYFPTKEDIVLQDGYDPVIAAAVVARPVAEPPLVAVRRGFADALAEVYRGDVEPIRQRTALILSVPALRSRAREQNASLVDHLQQALAQRSGVGRGRPGRSRWPRPAAPPPFRWRWSDGRRRVATYRRSSTRHSPPSLDSPRGRGR